MANSKKVSLIFGTVLLSFGLIFIEYLMALTAIGLIIVTFETVLVVLVVRFGERLPLVLHAAVLEPNLYLQHQDSISSD